MTEFVHGPENAEHEIRKAYNTVIEAGTCFFADRKAIPGVDAHMVFTFYKNAIQCYRSKGLLAAERWARTAKHLSRAFWHEAKIAYLEPRSSELPFLVGATSEEFNLHEQIDTTEDLLRCCENNIPPGFKEMPENMAHFISRARRHLSVLANPDYNHELLRAERIKAAYEYGRTLECMALAYEAEHRTDKAA